MLWLIFLLLHKQPFIRPCKCFVFIKQCFIQHACHKCIQLPMHLPDWQFIYLFIYYIFTDWLPVCRCKPWSAAGKLQHQEQCQPAEQIIKEGRDWRTETGLVKTVNIAEKAGHVLLLHGNHQLSCVLRKEKLPSSIVPGHSTDRPWKSCFPLHHQTLFFLFCFHTFKLNINFQKYIFWYFFSHFRIFI